MNWNARVIKEFRDNNGRVGGMFEGAPIVLVTTQGRRTGKPHTNPVIYLRDGDRWLIFGSNLGRPRHPDWFHNMQAYPQVVMEAGTDEGRVKPFSTRAEVLQGEERDRLFAKQCTIDPTFREYQEKTTRIIPVVALHPLDLSANPERNRMIGELLIQHHNDLRAALDRVRAELDGQSTGTPAATGAELAEQLRQHCLSYCYGLQLHHIREDGSFTAFEQRFPELLPAIARLREEHLVVERELERFEALLEEAAPAGPAALEKVRAELDAVVAGLEEHFAYEEQHLLPALNVPGREP
jgi:deazaflavin-dependent oxidoreductase (nitroreductase family)